MKTINGGNDEFSLGYSFYVTSDVLNLDKPAYKQFLVDGLKN